MIKVACTCGKTLTLADNLAGKFSRCPGCGGTVAVPEAAPRDDDDEPPPDMTSLEMNEQAKPPPPKPVAADPTKRKAAPQVACPKCGALYGVDVLFCNKCAIMIATGQPIAGVVPGGMSAPRKPDKKRPAWVTWVAVAAVLAIVAIVALKLRH